MDLWAAIKGVFGFWPKKIQKFPGSLGFFRWRVDSRNWVKNFRIKQKRVFVARTYTELLAEKFSRSGSVGKSCRILTGTTPEGGGVHPFPRGVSFALTHDGIRAQRPPPLGGGLRNLKEKYDTQK